MNAADILGSLGGLALIPVAFVVGSVMGGRRGSLALFFSVGSHLALSVLSAAEVFLPASFSDTAAFHDQAVAMSQGLLPANLAGPGSLVWSWAISLLYQPLGPSLLLGYVVIQWIYLAAMLQLAKFSEEIGAGAYRWHVVLFFSFTPAALLFCNFLLRESFQVLMLIIAIRYLEKYRRYGLVSAAVTAGLALIPFGAIHGGFFLFVPVALAIAVIARWLATAGDQAAPAGGRLMAVGAGAIVFVGSLWGLASYQDAPHLAAILSGDVDVPGSIASAAERGARTAFPWTMGSGLTDAVLSLPLLLLQFSLAPVIPFMVSAPEDLLAVAGVLVRLAFIGLSLVAYRRSGTEQRRMIAFLITLYVAFDAMASLGTTTVGTALRHDLKLLWIPIAVGMLARVNDPARLAASAPLPPMTPAFSRRPQRPTA